MLTEAEKPIACNLGALTGAEQARRVLLAQELQRNAVRISEMPDGFELTVDSPSSTALLVVEWFLLERRCCPFLRFSLQLEPETDVLRVQLSGRTGVKAFLAAAGLGTLASSPASASCC
jgi:hypothetical protein